MNLVRLVLCTLLVAAGVQADAASSKAAVRVTQRDLVPLCIDGHPANGGRKWQLETSEHAMTFTMRGKSQRGSSAPGPGIAVVRFTLVSGHHYEVEIRAESASYAARTWRKGEWRPVVRDRTTEQVASSEPEWIAGGCS